ncbi:hypothetical protein [Streptomyces sp. NPDC007355]|uniref:hypothetical protein n=1 Tax=Streptomyces sp. NPDC007355 TaxID=3364778 RepID=UPI0036CA8275
MVHRPGCQAPGVDCHRLSAEELRFIIDVLIAPPRLEGVTPQERPVAAYFRWVPASVGRVLATGETFSRPTHHKVGTKPGLRS